MTSALHIIDIVVVVCLGSAAPHLGPMMGLEPHHFALVCGASMTPVLNTLWRLAPPSLRVVPPCR